MGEHGTSPGPGRAFVKGGMGCLGAFIVIGLLFVVLGGSMRIDVGGAILLFVIGGLLGLLVFWIYRKGQRSRQGPPTNPS
jgi:hypothetical protein